MASALRYLGSFAEAADGVDEEPGEGDKKAVEQIEGTATGPSTALLDAQKMGHRGWAEATGSASEARRGSTAGTTGLAAQSH